MFEVAQATNGITVTVSASRNTKHCSQRRIW